MRTCVIRIVLNARVQKWNNTITVLGSLCPVEEASSKHIISINTVNTAIVLRIQWDPEGVSRDWCLSYKEVGKDKPGKGNRILDGSSVFREWWAVHGGWNVRRCERRSRAGVRLAPSQKTSGLLRLKHFSLYPQVGFNDISFHWVYFVHLDFTRLDLASFTGDRGPLSPTAELLRASDRSVDHME